MHRLLTLAALALLTPMAADAQTFVVCPTEADIEAQLEARYGERVRVTGLTSQGRKVVITATEDGRTWTLYEVRPGGGVCGMIAGEDLEIHDIAPEDDPA